MQSFIFNVWKSSEFYWSLDVAVDTNFNFNPVLWSRFTVEQIYLSVYDRCFCWVCTLCATISWSILKYCSIDGERNEYRVLFHWIKIHSYFECLLFSARCVHIYQSGTDAFPSNTIHSWTSKTKTKIKFYSVKHTLADKGTLYISPKKKLRHSHSAE